MTIPHGTVDGYANHGCRCLPCGAASADYSRERANGEHRTVPAHSARRIIDALGRRGLTRPLISELTGVSDATLARIANGRVQRVHQSTWDALDELMEDYRRPQAVQWIDPAPLLEALEYRAAAHSKGLVGLLGEHDARAFYKARNRGLITVPMADRLAITHLGTQLELLYGPDYDVEAA